MVNYKEILRLASEGTSQRQIAVSVGHSRDTVSEFLAAAKVHNLSWPLDESVTNEQIEAILFPECHSAISMYLEPDYVYIHSELAKRGVTLTLLRQNPSARNRTWPHNSVTSTVHGHESPRQRCGFITSREMLCKWIGQAIRFLSTTP